MKNRTIGSERSRPQLAVALLSALVTATCGNLTGGGFDGQVDVYATGDYTPAPATPQMALLSESSPVQTTHEDAEADEAEGTVEVEFMAFLVSEGGRETRLGMDDLRVKVDLQGVEEAQLVTQRVPAIRYSTLRLVFTEIKVEVEGGLVINGVPIVGELHVELEHLALVVERPIELDVGEGQVINLVVDLNAPSWLAAVDPDTRTVRETVFGDLVNVAIR